jgi:hypothetical protein
MKRNNLAILAIVSALCLGSWPARAVEVASDLIGTWKVTSFSVLFLDTNESVRSMGEHPTGYLQYSPGGHVVVFLAAEDRTPTASPAPTDAEAARFYRTIIGAYAGTYSLEGDKVVHHVVSAWTPEWNGGDQIRYFEIAGKNLTIKTAPLKSTISGRPIVSTLTFEKIE